MDILKEGYLLQDSGRYKLVRPPKELQPTQRAITEVIFAAWELESKGESEAGFDLWINDALQRTMSMQIDEIDN